MKLKTLIKFNNLKKEHNFNDNIARLILHLGMCETDSFRAMKDAHVIPAKISCFKDLSKSLPEFIITWRTGCHLTTIRHNARLTARGKEVYQLLSNI